MGFQIPRKLPDEVRSAGKYHLYIYTIRPAQPLLHHGVVSGLCQPPAPARHDDNEIIMFKE